MAGQRFPDGCAIAVTGASGFVGRHVLAALAHEPVTVIAHARVPGPGHVATERRRWSHFDLASACDDAFDRLGRPDIVIHLAWGGLPNYSSARHLAAEYPAQRRFLRGLAEAGLRRLVIAGTCLEYGMQAGCLSEETTPLPSNPYGAAKDALRIALEMPCKTASCDLRWLRLFYLYGEGQAPTSLYSQFRAAVARGERFFAMSPGDQHRDFMKVEDAAAAMVRIALAPEAPGLVNVCSGTPIAVRTLVERWRQELATDIALDLGALPYPNHEPFAFWGDNRRLSELLGAAAAHPA